MSSRYEKFEILKNVWLADIGIVKCRDTETDAIRYFLGKVDDTANTEFEDICYIIDNGVELNKEILEDLK